MSSDVLVIAGEKLARYGFGEGHPFGPDRHAAFYREFEARGLHRQADVQETRAATEQELLAFHTPDLVAKVRERSGAGQGWLDGGDTPAYRGVFEAASYVVGGTVKAMDAIMSGKARRGFVPIAGLHHAGRGHAAGFCVFNDCGVAIELLRSRHGLRRIAVVDFDVHHGNGTQAAFEMDADMFFASTHQWPLYPGTGLPQERGIAGNVVNVPLPPRTGSDEFREAFDTLVLPALEAFAPELVMISAGFDAHAADPLADLRLYESDYAWATWRLGEIADACAKGRMVSTLEGGYDLDALAASAAAHVKALMAA
jgi:acetoin utilization protein AcuC